MAGAVTGKKSRRNVAFVHAVSRSKLDNFIDTFNKYFQLTTDPLIISTMRLWSYLQNLSKVRNLYRTGRRLRIWERLFQTKLNEFITNMKELARKRAEGETSAAKQSSDETPPIHPLLAPNLAHEIIMGDQADGIAAPQQADLNDLMERTREEMEADLSTATAVEGEEDGKNDEDDDIFELAREEAPEPPPVAPVRAATPPPLPPPVRAEVQPPTKLSPLKTRAGRLAGRKKPDDLEEYLRSNPKIQIQPNGSVLVEGQPLQRYVEELNMMFSKRYEDFTTEAIVNNVRYRPLLTLFATDPAFNDKFIGNRLFRDKVAELRNAFHKERMTAPKKTAKAPAPSAPLAPPPPAAKKRAASTSAAMADPHAGIKTRPPIAARKPPVPPAPSKTTRRAASTVGPHKAGGKKKKQNRKRTKKIFRRSRLEPWIYF